MSRDDVRQAIMSPEPLMSNQVSFASEELQTIVLLRALRSAGIAQKELFRLCDTLSGGTSQREKVMRLRQIRFQLLARLHEQQRVLDDLDGYVDAMKKAYRQQEKGS